MQVSSINPSFQGRRDNIDAMIAADDNTIRQIAYLQTADKVNPKRDRRITNTLFYLAPVAAGLGEAILTKGNTKIFSKEVTGLAARAARGLKVTALWAAAIGAVDLLGYAKSKISENSPEVRRFDRQHPFLSLGAMLAAGLGVIALVNKGAVKLASKKAPEFLQNATTKVAKFLNKNSTVNSMREGLLEVANKTPSALKEIGATLLEWSPTMLLFGGLFHSINSAGRANSEFAKNYNDLKERQTQLSQARVRELSMENDFLMQDAKNREEIALLHEPLANLEEAIEEVTEELA